MLRLLYMLPSEKFGGAERQGTLTLKLLPDFGIKATALVGPGKMILDAFAREGISNYIHTDRFPDDPKHPLSFLENMQRYYYNTKCFIRSRRLVMDLLQKEQFDLIYATRTFSWIVSGFISRKTGIPVIWRCGSRFTDSFQRNLSRWFMKFSGIKALVSNCKAMQESWGEGLSIPSFVVNSSVNTHKFRKDIDRISFLNAHSLDKNMRFVGIAARPAPEKGPEFIIESIKKLSKKRNDFELLWAGESSWRKYLEGLFKKAGIKERVRFLGHIPDIEKFYASCDTVILASKPNSIEASPSALLEPMAMGKPVIATAVGGIPEIIEDRKNGLMVQYGDDAAFCDAIDEVLSNANLALRLGTNARETIDKEHNIQKNTKELAEIFYRINGHKMPNKVK